MRWKYKDKKKGFYIKKFLIFPTLYDDIWYWLETVYLFRRQKFCHYSFEYYYTDELVSKEEYMAAKERERNERNEWNERKARKEKE